MSALLGVLDTVADRLVVPGYSRWGLLLRRRGWDDLPSLRGRRAVVTGAASGIGKATALGLARLGADVVLVVRDELKGATARADVLAAVPGATVVVRHCDLSNLASVREFASSLEFDRVDVLVHNAGVLPSERTETSDGHELTFATHVVGPLLLTDLLRPKLAGGRVIFVSSGGMYTQRLPVDDPEYRSGTYRGATAYARTKRMQVTLAPLLTSRYAQDEIAVHAMHPGWADTPGVASSLPGFHRLTKTFLRTPEEGADTILWLAATAQPAGRFWHDRRERPTHLLPTTRSEDVVAFWQYCTSAAGILP
ncbi:SDR family NAD(P)-dependent oxidoreductase [Lentzea sp. NBRC 102530]|uniref:SDR family NAD(P)-dependent oxidoreductase n=1 Tax=Lentzea sp. NBRC 102530 TaxID=3032201 RepID=UPI0024A57B2C|nr:SDR family NAD(P)-dependent oxidoreductase [Lentzea sp. NBRC 102530]GLY50237.1 oxidoreductase [Lentzea sp. NBRC 102530]